MNKMWYKWYYVQSDIIERIAFAYSLSPGILALWEASHLFCFVLFRLLYFRFWEHVHIMQDCCIGTHMVMWFAASIPCHLHLAFLPMLSLPDLPIPCWPSLVPPKTPVCDAPLLLSMCSHCSTPAYEWEHVVFDFLFLCQFAKNDGFQIHPCPYKGQNSSFFMVA